MPTIFFQLLQTPAIFLDGQPVLLPYKKAEALLYCLAIKKSVSREQAAGLLWDTEDSQTAKKNLRHTLYTVKKVFGWEVVVSPKKHLLTLNPELEYEIDCDTFRKSGDLSLCSGELLEGFALKNADAFESWLTMERTELRDFYLRQLYDRMLQSAWTDVPETEQLFARYIKKEPLDERVYQLMMECYQKNRLYYKGIRVYQNLNKLLGAELGIAPCAELTCLHRDLLSAWSQSGDQAPEHLSGHLAGRKEELQFLTKSYRSFLLGTPMALLLYGDNGVGKTCLVNHFLDSIGEDACILLKTICFQAEQDFILQPWNAILLQLDRYIRQRRISVPANYLNHISALFPLFGDRAAAGQVPEDVITSYNFRTVCNSVLKLFFLLGEETPILLFLDNIQFMDNMSLDLLSLLLRERSPNVMCICTCLDPHTPPLQRHFNALAREKFVGQLRLEPLSRRDVEEIIGRRLGPDALNEQVVTHIYEDSEGNGFFLDMLLDYLGGSPADAWRLPSNPQNILLERLEGLSPGARQMLDTISVCPDAISLEIVEYIFRRDTLEIIELTEQLKRGGLIRERVREGHIWFQFRHAKMQEFVHLQLAPSKRRLLHSRVADYYEQTPNLLRSNDWYRRVAYHHAQAGNEAKTLQCKVLHLADYSRYNYELYPILRPQTDFSLEAPRQLTKYFDELSAELTRLYRYRPEAADFGELETQLSLVVGKYCISQGQYQKGLEAIRRCLANTDYLEAHPQVHISCLRQLTFYGIQTWSTPLMRENVELCKALARENRLGVDYAVECRLYGLYLTMCGRYEEAKEQLHEAISRFDSAALDGPNNMLNLAACYNYLGEVERKQERFESSLECYHRALDLCGDRKYPKNPTFYSNQGRALLVLGRTDQASEVFFAANRLYDTSNILMGRSITKSYCCLLRALEGRFDEARALLTEAQGSAETIGSPMCQGILWQVKEVLARQYSSHFIDLLPEDADTCRALGGQFLAGLPGAYEAAGVFPLPSPGLPRT